MMVPFNEYIRKNLDHFNDEEPLKGHFERFDRRLDHGISDKAERNKLWLIARIAASVVFAMVITYVAFNHSGFYQRNLDRIIISNNYPELKEVEDFYAYQLKAHYTKIRKLKFNNDKMQKKQIMQELSDMDRQVLVLKHDLLQNPDDERVMHAIINCYQVKLELMDMIIARTQESSNTIL
jgi:hypothetical protein